MRLITFGVVFLLIGAFFIISEKKLSVANTQDLIILKNDYSKWVLNTGKKTVGFVGQVIKMDWLPHEEVRYIEERKDLENDTNKTE